METYEKDGPTLKMSLLEPPKVTTPEIIQISNQHGFRYYIGKLSVGSCWQ